MFQWLRQGLVKSSDQLDDADEYNVDPQYYTVFQRATVAEKQDMLFEFVKYWKNQFQIVCKHYDTYNKLWRQFCTEVSKTIIKNYVCPNVLETTKAVFEDKFGKFIKKPGLTPSVTVTNMEELLPRCFADYNSEELLDDNDFQAPSLLRFGKDPHPINFKLIVKMSMQHFESEIDKVVGKWYFQYGKETFQDLLSETFKKALTELLTKSTS